MRLVIFTIIERTLRFGHLQGILGFTFLKQLNHMEELGNTWPKQRHTKQKAWILCRIFTFQNFQNEKP